MSIVRDMTFGRVAALAGVALGVMAANVAISFLYMVVYGHVIDPGHDQAYYNAHIQKAGPYCSLVAGIPVMFLVGWWMGMQPALIVWLIYTVIDLAIVVTWGATSRIGVVVTLSYLTKLGATYLGGLVASWRA